MYDIIFPKKRVLDDDEGYSSALDLVSGVRRSLSQYEPVSAQSLQELYREITERPKFSYDPNDDALYQNYKQSYTQQGRLAMEDAVGYAAGLTGGYGSSYGQAVGQQQYDAYVQRLHEVYPELYALSYNRYLDEGEALQQQYNLLWQQSEAEYEKYLDLLAQADADYDRNYAQEKEAYNRQQKAYDRLVDMMTSVGYVPTAEELAAAGMSEAHRDAYLNYFNGLQTAGGKGGRGGKKDDDEKETDSYDSALAAARARINKGVSVEDVNGEIAQKVARGELDKETARKLIGALTKEYYG